MAWQQGRTKGRMQSAERRVIRFVVDDALDPELAACIDPDGDSTDGLPDQYDVYLFDRCFQDYFWNYDNNGLKNLELRFYWEPVL
jgi:hypothetical protein